MLNILYLSFHYTSIKRITMKLFVSFLLIITFQFTLFSQTCTPSDYLVKGVKWELSNFNKKGKLSSTVEYEVLDNKQVGAQSIWEVSTEVFDKKGKPLSRASSEIICEKGVYKMDMKDMVPVETMQAIQNMDVVIDGSSIEYPTGNESEEALDDATISITASTSGMTVMNLKLTISNRKILGKETIETSAGTFDCVKITEDLQLENKLMNKQYSTTSWFLPGFRVVKSESYNHKGKLMSTSEITSLTK